MSVFPKIPRTKITVYMTMKSACTSRNFIGSLVIVPFCIFKASGKALRSPVSFMICKEKEKEYEYVKSKRLLFIAKSLKKYCIEKRVKG